MATKAYILIKVKAGKRYRIVFHNGMEDGHPVHLHRHSFELVSVGGKPTSGIIKDVVNVPRGGNAGSSTRLVRSSKDSQTEALSVSSTDCPGFRT